MTVMSEFIKPAHKSVARAAGYALTVGCFDSWQSLGEILLARLEPEGIGGIAYAASFALGADLSSQVYEATHGVAGMPITPFLGHMDEASFWADMAASDELDAYALASFNRMTPTRQATFRDYMQGRASA